MKLLSPDQVAEKLGFTKTAFRTFRQRDKTFPEPVKLSDRILRWDQAEVDNWILKAKGETTDGEAI